MLLSPAVRALRTIAITLAVLVVVPGGQAAAPGGAAGAAPPGWDWPIDAPHPIARAYSAPAERWGVGHRGIDIAAAVGSTVLAPDDGEVHFAGVVVDRAVLSIRHSGGVVSSYEPVSSALVAGDRVGRGDVIGELAAGPWHCASACLHLGVRRHGEYVSPLLYLGSLPRSVLLPTRVIPG